MPTAHDASGRATLSVILTVYNHAALLPRALDALVSQSRLPDELILMDDGSTDSTWEVIQRYAGRHPFIRPIRNERNLGVVQAAGRMLELATGEYLYGAAADDYVLPGFFENAMRLAQANPQAGIVFGGVDYHSPEVQQTTRSLHWTWREELFATPEQVLNQWLRQTPVDHGHSPATIFRMACLRSVGGFRADLGAWCDTFAIHAIALKYGACYIPMACAAFTMDAKSFSGAASRDFPLRMGVIDRAARLMASPEFCDRFPRDYVEWWVRESRRTQVGSEVALLLHHAKCFWLHLAALCRVPNAKGLALQLTLQKLKEKIGSKWRRRRG